MTTLTKMFDFFPFASIQNVSNISLCDIQLQPFNTLIVRYVDLFWFRNNDLNQGDISKPCLDMI